METTFRQYINNPTGGKSAVMSYRKMYEDLYHDKWDKLNVRENGEIQFYLYHQSHSHYYAHIKVPDESIENFYYDVVIKFKKVKDAATLADCPCQFFTNEPFFNYTFAYAFKKHKLTIPELESKMSKIALTTPAKVKNPNNTIGYVKSLYFAYIIMSEKDLFYYDRYDSLGKVYSKNLLLSNIEGTEEKMAARAEAMANLKSEKNAKIKDPEFSDESLTDPSKKPQRWKKTVNSSPNKSIGKFNGRIKKTNIGKVNKRIGRLK